MKRPPTSDGDRALAGRGRARTPAAGVPVDPLSTTVEDLDESFDALTPPPVMVEEIRGQLASRGHADAVQEMATLVAERVMQTVMHAHQLQSNRLMQVANASPGSERTHQRLAELESWRRDLDTWRLRLTGVDERNGRIGRLQDALEDLRCDIEAAIADLRRDLAKDVLELREDVGPRKEAQATRETAASVRSLKNRALAAIAAAAVAIGGGAYSLITTRDAAQRAAGRLEERLRHLEETDKRHDQALRWRGRGVPTPGIDFDTEPPPRNP